MKKSKPQNLHIPTGISHALGHDVKQPLGLIRAYSYYLKKVLSKDHPDLVSYTEKINVQVDLVAGMLNNIVESIKLENNQVVYKKEHVDSSVLLQDVVKDLSQKYSDTPFTSQIDSAPHTVDGDALYLHLALTNSIENSLRFSDKTKPVHVESKKIKQSLVIKITNTGSVIPLAEQNSIFEAFYKAKNASKSAVKGLGLGLFLSREILKAHQGTISLKSGTKTTQVLITLPLVSD